MATQTRNPTSDDAVSGTWTGSAGSRFGVVDDYPDTTGADELTHGTTAGNLTFGYSAFTIPSNATNISVFVDYYDYKNGSQGCNIGARLKVGASYFNAATHNPANGSANRTQRTDTFATNPATSAAWTADQINGTAGSDNLVGFGWVSTDASPTITLSSVRLRVTYDANTTLALASGTYTYSGKSATFPVGRKLALASGTYTYSGKDATFTVDTGGEGTVLTAESGAYTYSGKDAAFSVGRKLALAGGEYVYSGKDASFRIARKLALSSGNYAYVGRDAIFTVDDGEEDPPVYDRIDNSRHQWCRRCLRRGRRA